MLKRSEWLFTFMVRNALYGVVPGMWFAYLGGVSLLWGAAGGLGALLLVALPVRLAAFRGKDVKSNLPDL